MAGLYDAIGDFFSPEAGQRRTRAMSDAVRRAEYYVPPEMRGLLGFAGEMSPVAGLQRAGQASGRMFDADRTAGQRVGDLGEMLSETAGVAAPMMVAGRAGVPIANAIQEGLLGFSSASQQAGRAVADRLNQPGPVPTMYSNPLGGGAKPKSITAYHGGTGDVASAAGGRGAWFSENKDLADEYAFGGGSVNQFNISPERPIEFLHAEQRRPIGDIISTAVENSGDLSDQTIAAARGKISALKKRYGDEKRPLFEYWNNDPDIADLFRTLGYDSISVAEKSGGPQTWAALTPDIISSTPSRPLSPSEQMAKEVLDLRAAGRAGDVTEDMMAKADPQYMYSNTPLPMDEASRMARAGEISSFHGTTANFPAFDGRSYAASNFGTHMGDQAAADAILQARRSPYLPKDAPAYVEGSQVLPLRVNTGPMLRVEDTETWNPGATQYAMAWSDDPAAVSAYNRLEKNPDYPKFGTEAEQSSFIQNDLQDSGFGGFVYDNKFEGGGDSYAVFDPTNIRSRFARFDPEFRHLRNLSAGVGGLGLLGMSYPQEDQY